MNEFDEWGLPAIVQMKTDHADFSVTRYELAEIMEQAVEQLKKDGRKVPQWVMGNLLADINLRTHQKYHSSRPRNNVCFHCLGTGEKPTR